MGACIVCCHKLHARFPNGLLYLLQAIGPLIMGFLKFPVKLPFFYKKGQVIFIDLVFLIIKIIPDKAAFLPGICICIIRQLFRVFILCVEI